MTDYLSEIKKTGKKVAIYGMGNGAEKIISYLKANGIDYSCVFASDGFVRGQCFLGERVLSLSEAKEKFGDIIIVTAFALEGERDRIFYDLKSKFTLYSPNLPPYGENVIDIEYINQNSDKIEKVRSLFRDELSVKIFDSVIKYDISGNIDDLVSDFSYPENYFGLYFADIGAYDGDTVEEYIKNRPDYKSVYAFEPGKVYNKLIKNTEKYKNIVCENTAVTDYDGFCDFSDGKGRGSAVGDGKKQIKCFSIDNYFKDKNVDTIKIDGEGEDMKILKGGVNVICERLPSLSVAVYHRAFDIIDIPIWLSQMTSGYDFYLRRKEYIPAFDVFLYAVRKKNG